MRFSVGQSAIALTADVADTVVVPLLRLILLTGVI
jgi:hypothetical protein